MVTTTKVISDDVCND